MDNRLEQIDQLTRAFQEHFKALKIKEIHWKPNPQTWSIAQNIEHIILINQSYFPKLEELRSGKYSPPFLSKFSFLTNFLGNAILKSVQPDRKKKSSTFPIWEPSPQPSDYILQQFIIHQDVLKQELLNSSDLIKKGVIISSPANKNIPYPLDMAFNILISHELRHLEQAKGILKQLELEDEMVKGD